MSLTGMWINKLGPSVPSNKYYLVKTGNTGICTTICTNPKCIMLSIRPDSKACLNHLCDILEKTKLGQKTPVIARDSRQRERLSTKRHK